MRPIAIIDRGRGPELAGTRITVFDVLHYLLAGHTPAYIAEVLGLSTAEVDALVRYFEMHREEVLTIHQQIEERIARGNPAEVVERLAKSPSHSLIQARLEEVQRRRQEANGEGYPQR